MSSIVRIFSWLSRLTFYSTRRQPSWIELLLIFQRMKIFAPLNEWKIFIICFIQHRRRSNRTLPVINKLCFTPYIKDKVKLESSLLDYIQIAVRAAILNYNVGMHYNPRGRPPCFASALRPILLISKSWKGAKYQQTWSTTTPNDKIIPAMNFFLSIW